jgi:hypothetical protein
VVSGRWAGPRGQRRKKLLSMGRVEEDESVNGRVEEDEVESRTKEDEAESWGCALPYHAMGVSFNNSFR